MRKNAPKVTNAIEEILDRFPSQSPQKESDLSLVLGFQLLKLSDNALLFLKLTCLWLTAWVDQYSAKVVRHIAIYLLHHTS